MRRFVLLIAVLVLVASACGDDAAEEVQVDDTEQDGGNAPADVDGAYLSKVARDTLDASTGRFEQTTEMSGSMMGQALDGTITAEGEYDTANQASHLTVDMTEYFDAVMGNMGSGLMQGLGQDMTMETIQIDSMTYIKSGLFSAVGADADSWVSVDVSELGEASELSGAGAGVVDPSNYLALLEGAGDEVEDLGTVDVRGTETTGYGVTVSFDEIASSLVDDPDAQAEMDQTMQELGLTDTMATELPMEVYVDADGMVRRVVVSIDLGSMFGGMTDGFGGLGEPSEPTPTTEGGESFTVTSTVDFFDYGAEDIDIQAPPADEVVPFEDVMGSFTE